MARTASSSDAGSGYTVSVDAGEYIYRAGDSAAEIFIIRAGQVELLKSVAGEDQSLATLAAGDVFGELAVLDVVPREATARAVTACELLKIDRATLVALIERRPEIAVELIRRTSRRLSESRERLLAAGVRPASTASGRRRDTSRGRAPSALRPAATAEPARTAEATPARLIEDHPTGAGASYTLGSTTTIGRTSRNAIVIAAPDVSRSHARIDRVGAAYVLRDLDSQNGTFVNGLRITERRLEDHDRVRIGDTASFAFVMEPLPSDQP